MIILRVLYAVSLVWHKDCLNANSVVFNIYARITLEAVAQPQTPCCIRVYMTQTQLHLASSPHFFFFFLFKLEIHSPFTIFTCFYFFSIILVLRGSSCLNSIFVEHSIHLEKKRKEKNGGSKHWRKCGFYDCVSKQQRARVTWIEIVMYPFRWDT